MKSILITLGTIVLLVTAACSNDNSSSSGAAGASFAKEATVTAASGTKIYFEFPEEGTLGVPLSGSVILRKDGVNAGVLVGTIHWGDFTDTRVRDGMSIEHTYQFDERSAEDGRHNIALQIDGEEKVTIASVLIRKPAPTALPTSSFCPVNELVEPGSCICPDGTNLRPGPINFSVVCVSEAIGG